jgi:pyroglutamyl-peptidase
MKILLTSFDIWQSYHKSNSSDDLLNIVWQQESLRHDVFFLRKLHVCFERAPSMVVEKIEEIQPELIICCGMAESREILTIESQARSKNDTLKSNIELTKLVNGLKFCQISNDAGQFVCERLYYEVLRYIVDGELTCKCLFVHVPILTDQNREKILSDFLAIMSKSVSLIELG